MTDTLSLRMQLWRLWDFSAEILGADRFVNDGRVLQIFVFDQLFAGSP